MHDGSKGFTLMELLVVIAIIVLLLALVFPAMRSARQRGLQISCLSDMRQVGLAIFNYAGFHYDRFPGFGSGAGDRYIHRVAPYLGGEASNYGAWRQRIFRCSLTPGRLINEQASAGVYGMNIWTMLDAVTHTPLQPVGPSVLSFHQPSKTILLGETIATESVGQQLMLRHDGPYPERPNGAANNHGGNDGAGNYIYMDGRGVYETEWPGSVAFERDPGYQ